MCFYLYLLNCNSICLSRSHYVQTQSFLNQASGEMMKENTYNTVEQEEGSSSDEESEGKERVKSGGHSDGCSRTIAVSNSDSIRVEKLETTGILTDGTEKDQQQQQHPTEVRTCNVE